MGSSDHEIGSQAKLHCCRGYSKGKKDGVIWYELKHGEGMERESVFGAWWAVRGRG